MRSLAMMKCNLLLKNYLHYSWIYNCFFNLRIQNYNEFGIDMTFNILQLYLLPLEENALIIYKKNLI